MFKLLQRIYINDKDEMNTLREKYGILCSLLSIGANIICVLFKLIFGVIVHSSAIVADGFNNLSDATSNIVSLIGFKISNKQPDAKHPYGHGRFEYLAGLFIAIVILIVGVTSLYESVLKIFKPVNVIYSTYALIVLIISILIKLWMYSFNHYAGKKISSSTLEAAAQDSLNDVITTIGSIVALVSSRFTSLPLDGIIGAIVSIIVLKSGVDICLTTIDDLLGKEPDKEEIKQITKRMMSFEGIYGVHDLIIHDYGPGRRYLTAHLEVPSTLNTLEAHNLIDRIERVISSEYQIYTTIHCDPIEYNDPLTNELRGKVMGIVKDINKNYSIHDFRIVRSQHTKLIFDVVIETKAPFEINKIENTIINEVKKINENYECIIDFDFLYIS